MCRVTSGINRSRKERIKFRIEKQKTHRREMPNMNDQTYCNRSRGISLIRMVNLWGNYYTDTVIRVTEGVNEEQCGCELEKCVWIGVSLLSRILRNSWTFFFFFPETYNVIKWTKMYL